MRRHLSVLARRARDAGGHTLVELVAVMGILSVVLAALVGAWVSGFKSETDAQRRYEAQQNARIAVDKMRDELHCADQLTLVAANLMNARLPADCPEAAGAVTTITYDTQVVSTGRYKLRRNSVMVADYLTSGNVFSYIAPSPSSLGKLHVDLPVDLTPSDTIASWRLAVDIVLRNTVRA